jgi:flagellar biosynthesis chaperone FliJ
MIRLGGLVSQKAFGKFEMGKVISNPFANAFVNEAEGEDHEVSMGQNQLDTIIKMATELKAKMGENEKEIPAWIQDHISKAENYISQATGNYHEYGDSNENINEAPKKLKHTISKKEWSKIPKYNKHIGMDGIHYIMKYDDKLGTYLQGVEIVDESVNEDSPCWKGYKQVGMKDKGGRQVPNCVPNESVVKEISGRTPKIFVKTAAVEKKIKELMADRKKAVVPYNSETDPAKKEKLKQILVKLTNQIKGYENNLVKLRDMEEEYLQQMHADAELDTTGL